MPTSNGLAAAASAEHGSIPLRDQGARPPPDRDALVRTVAGLLGVEPVVVHVESASRRLYSETMVVSLGQDPGRPRYLVKHAQNSLQRQHWMLTKANAAISLPFFHRVGSIYDPDANILVLDHFDGRSLRERLTAAPLFGTAGARAGLLENFERVGAWLRAFHRIDAGLGDATWPCKAYLIKRLARLDEGLGCEPLQRLADDLRLRSIPIALSHGDFTPQNILFDAAGRLAVIDYGISEWEHMAPSWDLQSFEVGCDRIFNQSYRQRWRAWRLGVERLRAAFWRGYAEVGTHRLEHDLAGAMRHVSFLVGHVDGDTWDSSAARWHRRALQQSLAHLAAIRPAAPGTSRPSS